MFRWRKARPAGEVLPEAYFFREKAAIFQKRTYKTVMGIRQGYALGPWCERRWEGGAAQALEKKLRALFDFQKYEQNADLQSVIDRVHARYSNSARMLSDDEADLVAAAGMPETAMKKRKGLLEKDDDNS